MFRRILGGTPASASAPQSDIDKEQWEIFPLHQLDQLEANRFSVGWVLMFNDVLDAGRLNDALSRLMTIGDWKKLGGRLKRSERGHLEIHVPRTFTAERPAVAFTHDRTRHETCVKDDPIASHLPGLSGKAATQPIDEKFHPFQAPSDYPTSLDMMIERACPMVSLHVTSFKDATVVGVAWPHVLLDAATHVFMLQAWSLVLAGRESEVPSVMDVRDDVLLEWEKQQCAANNGHEKPIVESKRVAGHRLARMVAKHLWERSQSPAMETKAICLPRASCERLVEQTRRQIAEAGGASGKSTTVSEDDILTAWAAHMLGSLEPKPRPMSITSICSVRHGIQTPQPGVHLQTMLSMSSTFLTADESAGSTAAIALAKAQQTAKQTTRSQMLGFTSWLRANTNSDGSKAPTLLYAEDNNSLCVVGNSLAKLDIFEAVDFAPAVVSKGQRQAQQNNPPGTMVFYYNQPVHKSLEWINAFYTLGRDRDGDCWMVGHFLPRTWDRVNESLANLAN